jgi:hypothetical protein
MITDTIANQPRTLQQTIGPSELGIPCTRRLIHKLVRDQEPSRRDPAWLAYIGSCVHSGLESGIRRHPMNQATDRPWHPEAQPRFLLEERVHVGDAGGQQIWGNADVFDIDSGTVVDWKVVGPDRLSHYIKNGPGPQYRTQAHLYGRGFARAGYTVNTVMIMFLPREGQLRTHHMWAEPYDESVALQGLERVDTLYNLIDVIGLDECLALYPLCNDWFCPWCKKDRHRARLASQPRQVSTITSMTTAELFGT